MANTQPILLKSISLKGFLSYGPEVVNIPLTALNVLIGPNGSGKSNLIEALSVLRAVPRDLPLPIRQGGGVKDWLWHDGTNSADAASLDVLLAEGRIARTATGHPAVRYHLEFGAEGDTFKVLDERVENELPKPGHPRPYFYFGYERGRPVLNLQNDVTRELQRANIDPTQSILSQIRDPEGMPELTRLADLLRRIVIYRSWQFGPDSLVRGSCRADVRTDTLSESFDNLPVRLAVLMAKPMIKRRLIELLGELAPGFDDLVIVPEGGVLQLYLTEGSRAVPARRLSDGTLRYLCLLAILLDPEAASLVALEEPELGLHPDVLPTLRDLMLEASEKTQLIITTHSTQLADALTDHASTVLVCEKKNGLSQVSRLTQEEVDRNREHGGLIAPLPRPPREQAPSPPDVA